MAWLYLFVSIILEVCGTISMKLSEGFSKPLFAIPMIIFYILSILIFTLALRKIEISVAYAIWAGVGTALITAIGILYFRDMVTLQKLLFIGLIIVGVVGLNLSGARN